MVRHALAAVVAAMAATSSLVTAQTASGARFPGPPPFDRPPLVQLSTDPYRTPKAAQYSTAVEPDSFSYGSTIVSAFQVGRFVDGAAVNNGFATSTDSGRSWRNGVLPGITVAASGTALRASDPVVAYDAAHDVWLISSLAVGEFSRAVVTSRSTDGGLTGSRR